MTAISAATTLVGIIGWPVRLSLSPRMHNAAFEALGLDWAYVPPLPVPPERLEDAVRGLAALGFVGANVTTPHKLAVTSLCETDAASVNTLVVRDRRIEGSSTDAAILDGLPHVNPVVVGLHVPHDAEFGHGDRGNLRVRHAAEDVPGLGGGQHHHVPPG